MCEFKYQSVSIQYLLSIRYQSGKSQAPLYRWLTCSISLSTCFSLSASGQNIIVVQFHLRPLRSWWDPMVNSISRVHIRKVLQFTEEPKGDFTTKPLSSKSPKNLPNYSLQEQKERWIGVGGVGIWVRSLTEIGFLLEERMLVIWGNNLNVCN